MRTVSCFQPRVLTLTTFGCALAFAVMFVFGFATLVDTPHPEALGEGVHAVATVSTSVVTNVHTESVEAGRNILKGSLYSTSAPVAEWVKRTDAAH